MEERPVCWVELVLKFGARRVVEGPFWKSGLREVPPPALLERSCSLHWLQPCCLLLAPVHTGSPYSGRNRALFPWMHFLVWLVLKLSFCLLTAYLRQNSHSVKFTFESEMFRGSQGIHKVVQLSCCLSVRILPFPWGEAMRLWSSLPSPLLQPLESTTKVLLLWICPFWHFIWMDLCSVCSFVSELFHLACCLQDSFVL